MKKQFFSGVLGLALVLASNAAIAGSGQIGSANIDKLDALRTESVKKYVLSQSAVKGSSVATALQDAPSELVLMESMKVVETESVINGHPKDSHEERSYLIVVPYLDGQSTNFDENDEYRSNTARFSSLQLRCSLAAKSFGSNSVKINCGK